LAAGLARPDGSLFPINPDEGLTRRLLFTIQLVAGMLLLGVVVFLGVALYIVWVQHDGQGLASPRDLPTFSLVAVLMLGACAPLAFVLPGIQTRVALRRILEGTWTMGPAVSPTTLATDAAKLLVVRQTTLIVGLALLEGAAFMGCMAYLLGAQVLSLGVVGVAVALMLCKFPTAGRVRAWLGRQADVLNELRRQRGSVAGQ
jgi:hypothetical protein